MDYALRKTMRAEDGTRLTVPQVEEIYYDYSVDLQGLRAMAIKAASNKSGRSVVGRRGQE